MQKQGRSSRRELLIGMAGGVAAATVMRPAAAQTPTPAAEATPSRPRRGSRPNRDWMPAATFEDRSLDPTDYIKSLSNWGRWGKDDVLGTLNLITPKVRAAAYATLREGITVGCSFKYVIPQQKIGSHTHWGTHVDGLAHMFLPNKKMYNGFSGDDLPDMTILKDGIVSRGVLLDATKLLGVQTLATGYAVKPEQLEEMEKRQGVKVREGDIVFLRVGRDTLVNGGADRASLQNTVGWHASCLPWLHKRGVAAIGGDHGQEPMPSGFEWSEIPYPIHFVGIPAMGLWLIDWCDLEELAATCARLKRYEFLMSIGLLRIPGTDGSQTQPIAMF